MADRVGNRLVQGMELVGDEARSVCHCDCGNTIEDAGPTVVTLAPNWFAGPGIETFLHSWLVDFETIRPTDCRIFDLIVMGSGITKTVERIITVGDGAHMVRVDDRNQLPILYSPRIKPTDRHLAA